MAPGKARWPDFVNTTLNIIIIIIVVIIMD
jgi:hypothetical protein